ncbi:hypothetical protein [Flavobacterium poyangense]|jgi:hypothetical protein|uniref:hypothetical protein n=1 Tax=Flavobacterium poyangense TaxID=2204302 RepID=UPI00141F2D1F|nr:hypothetical protein [Flavobacterium sp. JXAS1]
MNNFYSRLAQLSEHKGFKSINKFALDGLNYSSSEKLNRLKKENTNPSVDILLDISNKFEDVSIEWLLTGKGAMLRVDNTSTKLLQCDCNEKISELEDRIKFYKEKIEFVERKLEECEDEKKRIKTIS